jgi:Protein of unknown function (DUF2752)
MTARSGFAATVLGAILLLELVMTNLAFTADDDFVYFFGSRINVACAARQRLGVPCPTCGFTRGFVLTVHGRVRDAWRLSPTGPLAVVGILGMGVALLAFAGFERRSTPAQVAAMKRWVQAGALAYGGVGTLIWISSWISVLTRLKWMRG